VISFRYHLVSIIAVFLALALGVVVGTTGLNGQILKDLRRNVRNETNSNKALQATNTLLQKQAGNGDSFDKTYLPQLVAGKLNQNVVIIGAPGASGSMKSAVADAVSAAGGTVVGGIQLTSEFNQPARDQDLQSFATAVTLTGPNGAVLPTTSVGSMLVGYLLAFVLSGKSGAPTDISVVVAGLAQKDFLTTTNNIIKPATLAVIVTSGTLVKNDPKAAAMTNLVTEFSSVGFNTVVAGDAESNTESGLVAQVRASSTLDKTVATVDNADTGLGQFSTVCALADLALAVPTVDQYGSGSGARRLFPAPTTSAPSTVAPTAGSPTATPTK
jgi:hypothetical protein